MVSILDRNGEKRKVILTLSTNFLIISHFWLDYYFNCLDNVNIANSTWFKHNKKEEEEKEVMMLNTKLYLKCTYILMGPQPVCVNN